MLDALRADGLADGPGRATARVRELLDQVGLGDELLDAAPAAALRRPAPARRPSPAPSRPQPEVIVCDEAGLGARRLDPGAGPRPARRPAATSSASPTSSSPTTSASSSTSADRVLVMKDGKVVEFGRRRRRAAAPAPPVHAETGRTRCRARSSASRRRPPRRPAAAHRIVRVPRRAIASDHSDRKQLFASTCSRWPASATSRTASGRCPATTAHRFADLDYWLELAELLEHGGFDGALPCRRDRRLRRLPRRPGHRPAGGAADARHRSARCWSRRWRPSRSASGSASPSRRRYEPPFAFARRISTLDHLTKGRVGWNIVTSYLAERRPQLRA